MKTIHTSAYDINFGDSAYIALKSYINNKNPSKTIIIVDSNTKKLCLPLFLKKSDLDQNINLIEIPNGEISVSAREHQLHDTY